MDNITNKVLNAIKGEKPSAKWKFIVKDYVIWAAGILSIIVGALSTAVTIYMITNNDWSLHTQISGSLWKFVLITMPYFWVLTIVLLIALAYYNFKHTKHGYHYKLLTIVMGSILVSIFLGLIFYSVGLGQIIDNAFVERIPIYEKFGSPRRMIWNQSENGRLAGKIIVVRAHDFDLIDLKKHNWTVDTSGDMMSSYLPMKGEMIKIIGVKIDEAHFRAENMFPFDVRGGKIDIFKHKPNMIPRF